MGQAVHAFWRRVLQALPSFHISVKTMYTLGLISDTSLLLDDAVIEEHLDWAEREGSVASHTASLVILGRCGAGKTSLSLTLRGKQLPASEDPPKTLGLEESLAEVSFADMRWRSVGRSLLEALSKTEFVRARLFSVAEIVGKERQHLKGEFRGGQVKMMLIFVVVINCLLALFLWAEMMIRVHFSLLFLLLCGIHALVNKSHKVYFLLGYGCSIVLELIRFAATQNYSLDLGVGDTASNLATVAAVIFVTCLFMGLGTGAGVTLAFCLYTPTTVERSRVPFSMLCVYILIGHLVPFLKSRRRSVCLHFAVIGANFAAALLVRKNETLYYSSLGVLVGYLVFFGIECGQLLAPKLSLGGNRSAFVTNAVGFIAGCCIAQGFDWSFKSHTPLSTVCSVVTCGFCLYMLHSYHRHLNSRSHDVPLLQSMLDNSADPRQPARIALIDCAGDDVYREAQHIYMTPSSNYIVVFRVTDVDADNSKCDATFRNVSQWLNSASAHCSGATTRAYLVATHKATVPGDRAERETRLKVLERRLRRHYSHMLVPVPQDDKEEGRRVIFQIDNRHCDDSDRELRLLRQSIVDNANSRQVPLVWFHFLDIIRGRGPHEPAGTPLPALNQLFDLVRERCELRDRREFKDMLQHFSDCGEIFYDPLDAELSSFVLLDRTILVDIVRRLVRAPRPHQPPKLFFGRQELRRCLSGLVPSDSFDRLLHFLQALKVLVPKDKPFLVPGDGSSWVPGDGSSWVPGDESSWVPGDGSSWVPADGSSLVPADGSSWGPGDESFWVPFNLPECPNLRQLEEDLAALSAEKHSSSAEFHFLPCLPSALFLRLLPLCARLPAHRPARLARSAALLRGPLPALLALPHAAPRVIAVRVGGERPRASALLLQLAFLVQHLCRSHFRSLTVTLRLACASCSEQRPLWALQADSCPPRRLRPSRCGCGAVRAPPAPLESAGLALPSGQVVSFRFATDLLLLSHEAPPRGLLAALERQAGDALQVCTAFCAAAACAAHLREARTVLVAASGQCGACRLLVEALWTRSMQTGLPLVPVLTQEAAAVPQALRGFRALAWEDARREECEEALRRIVEALRR